MQSDDILVQETVYSQELTKDWCRSNNKCEIVDYFESAPGTLTGRMGGEKSFQAYLDGKCSASNFSQAQSFARQCPASRDCSLSEWEPASGCGICGPPFDQAFVRKIVAPAKGGGRPCSDYAILEERPCNVAPCD